MGLRLDGNCTVYSNGSSYNGNRISRYVFKVQFVPGEEIARYLMIWCGYAGAAMGFRTHAQCRCSCVC